MKIGIKNFIIQYMIIFPIINLAYQSIFHGRYTNVFCVLSEFIILGLAIHQYKLAKKEGFILLSLLFFIPLNYLIHGYLEEIPIMLNFVYFVGVAIILNTYEFKREVTRFINNNIGMISIESVIYISIILFTVISGTGLKQGWGTTTLKGPYGTPHTLAYELLTLLCLNLFIILKSKKWINAAISIALIVMVLLTASRSALIGLIIVLSFFVSRFGLKKKLLILMIVVIFVGYLSLSTSILGPLLEKTKLAISNGSVSNGRLWIFESSIKTFLQYKGAQKWIVGIGYNNLLEGNLRLINYDIQSHNDILNAFIAFGVIFFTIFVYSIFRMINGVRGTIFKLIFLMALINLNGLVSYRSLAIPLIVIMTFMETERVSSKRICESKEINI